MLYASPICHMKIFYIFLSVLFSLNLSAQAVKLKCTIKEKKNEDGPDPIIIKTCFYKNFKLVKTSFPDYVGRYAYSEHELFVQTKGKKQPATNQQLFNQHQDELLSLINKRVKQDFDELKADSNSRECLEDLNVIPYYKMDDLKISFEDDDIWFEVQWGLRSGCLAVDGTIVTFKLNEIKKYLN